MIYIYIYIYIHPIRDEIEDLRNQQEIGFLLGIHMVSRFCRLFRKSLFFVSICFARSEAPRNRFTYYFFFSGQWSTTLEGWDVLLPKK